MPGIGVAYESRERGIRVARAWHTSRAPLPKNPEKSRVFSLLFGRPKSLNLLLIVF